MATYEVTTADGKTYEVETDDQQPKEASNGFVDMAKKALPMAGNAVAMGMGFPEFSTIADIAADPEKRKQFDEIASTPYRGLRGMATSATSGLQRGAEAVGPGFMPSGVKEHMADLVASLGDPRNVAMNAPVGAMLGAGLKGVQKVAAPIGKELARAAEALSGAPARDLELLVQKPMEVLKAGRLKKVGKAFQDAKVASGVTEAEERLTAGIGDPSGFKAVADKMFDKFKEAGDLTVGEALAWKKAAGEMARKGKGSAKAIYSKDAAEAQRILVSKGKEFTGLYPKNPAVNEMLEKQAEYGLSKARSNLTNLIPRNKGGTPAVIRALAGLGIGTGAAVAGINPLLGLVTSPAAWGAAGAATGLGNKAAEAGVKSPAVRQMLLGLLEKLKQ